MTYVEKIAAQAGLIYGTPFDTALLSRGRGYSSGYAINSGQSNPTAAVMDSSRKASGNDSVKFTIPSESSAGSAGQVWFNFKEDRSVTFGAGDTFYFQLMMAWDRYMLEHTFTASNPSGFKACIMGQGDPADSSCVFGGTTTGCSNSHSDIEIVMNERSGQYKIPIIYNDIRTSSNPWQEAFGGSDYKEQNGIGSPFCLYSTRNDVPSFPNCFHYIDGMASPSAQVTRWATVTFEIQLGALVVVAPGEFGEGDPGGYNKYQNCKGSQWISWGGDAATQLYNEYVFQQPMQNGDMEYGKAWVLPYMTDKDSAEVHTPTYFWAQNPIVATSPIPLTTTEGPEGQSQRVVVLR